MALNHLYRELYRESRFPNVTYDPIDDSLANSSPLRQLASRLLVIVSLIASSGCHLLVNGNSQTVHIDTTPSGAAASFGGLEFTTPATLHMNRRDAYAVLRASKEGYAPRCELVKAESTGFSKMLTVIDSIPAALGLAIDGIAGSLQGPFPETISLTLEPAGPDEDAQALPSDEEILSAWDRGAHDLCQSGDLDSGDSYTSPEDVVQATQAAYARIVVTTGPISQQYAMLGNVHADTRGLVNIGSVLNDALFRSTLAASIQATPTANNAQMNQLLRQNAMALYGAKVDAIINVAYRVEPSGDVAADGLAVTFPRVQEGAAPEAHPARAAATVEERLRNLKALLDQGLISKDEYKSRRARVLQNM
jgi:hypothetical protein